MWAAIAARADRVVRPYNRPRAPHRTYRTTATIESPKTADMGVAIYAVMALTSCTGTALVVRGRKRK